MHKVCKAGGSGEDTKGADSMGKAQNSNAEHFQQWCFQETAKLERKRKELEREEKLLEQEKSLLNMKLDILKEEYRKLADEKRTVQARKAVSCMGRAEA